MPYSFFILLLSPFIIGAIRTFTVLVHELGHGLIAIVLTKAPVDLYIGAFGNPAGCHKFTLGKLTLYYKPNFLNIGGGLCVPSTGTTIFKNFFIVLAGPLASAIFAIGAFFVFKNYTESETLSFFILCIFLSFCIDAVFSIIPRSEAHTVHGGRVTYNDGQQLRELLKYRSFPKEFEEGLMLYYQQNFKEAALLFETALEKTTSKKEIFRLAIAANVADGNYTKAHELNEEFFKKCSPGPEDFEMSAFLKSHSGNHEGGAEDYKKVIKQNPRNINARCNYSYTLFLMGKYDESIAEFDKVIAAAPDNSYAYSSRGLELYKSGKIKEGLADIMKAVEIGDDAYAFRNLGIFYFDNEDYEKALLNFETAFTMNKTTHQIEEYLSWTQQKLDSFKNLPEISLENTPETP